MAPASRPRTIDAHGVMKPQAGVMATRPATAPEAAPTLVGLPSRNFSTTIQPPSAAAVATWVFMNAMTGETVGAERGTGVEAEPAEPQQTGAEQDQRHVVRTHRVLLEADPLAEHDAQGQGRGTGVDVDRRTTGEVLDAGLAFRRPQRGQPARLAAECAEVEHPVRDREVDDGRPERGEDRPAQELRPVGDRSRRSAPG